MADVTYLDEDGSAPVVKFLGIEFRDGVPVSVEDESAIDLIRLNRFFVVEDAVKRRPGRPPKVNEGGE